MRSFSKDVWVLIGLLAFLIVAAIFSKGQQEASSDIEIFPKRTTYSARPGGVKALYETLRALDYPVRRNNAKLTDGIDDGVLFIVSPETPVSHDEWDAVRRWIERGNLLVIAANKPPEPRKLGEEPKSTSARPVLPSFISPGVQSVRMAGDERIDSSEIALDDLGALTTSVETTAAATRSVVPLYRDKAGTVVAMSSWGRGSVIMLSDGWPVSNQGIERGNNFLMVLNALNHREPDRKMTVTFDEFHHGYAERKGIMSLIDTPARLGLALILLAFLLLVFAASRRFGRPVPLIEQTRQRGEYLSSMASLLRKAQATDIVRDELGRRFLADIATAVGVAPGSHVDIILSAAQKRYPEKMNELTELCEAAVSGENIKGEAAIFAMARRWHKMRQEFSLRVSSSGS
ncbi:MAG: DUF4350 domain-containing protein [Armatimonadota bacterium]|nr:DUF4350 domain-containing protein [bacterium]